MKTNFFENIARLNAPGIWKMGILHDENGQFTVSALYAPNASNDPAVKSIAPLIFKGTAEELGEGFFEAIEKPVQETAGLYNNLAAYTKTVEAAKKVSYMRSSPLYWIDFGNSRDKGQVIYPPLALLVSPIARSLTSWAACH